MKKLILLVAIGSVIASSLYILKKRASIYPYDVTKGYEYNFSKSNAHVAYLSLNKGKIVLPELDSLDQSAFVGIRIDSTFMGRYFEPSITMTSNHRHLKQFFERGASGLRYINISQLTSKKGGEIKLEGKYLSFDDQAASLISFHNKDIEKEKVLVIAPHPDDAEIAAFGLYSSNKKTYIVTITAGDAGKNKYDEVYPNKVNQYLKKGELRTWNSITVPLLGGIPPEQTINLGFFDGTLTSMYKDKSKLAEGLYTHSSDISIYRKQNISSLSSALYGKSDWASLVGNLKYLLEEIKPDIIVAPYPALDDQKDHKSSSIALFEAIKKANIKEGALYLYTNHFALNHYYPYGKVGSLISLPPNFGQTFYFDSIYSHALLPKKQKDKLFALEAMHDLRLDTEWRFTMGALKIAMKNLKRDISGKENSYYKRAVRSNELFFVVDINNIYNNDKLNGIIGTDLSGRP